MDTLLELMQAGLGRLAWATLQSLPLGALVWALCRWLPRLGANARCWLWWLVSLQLVLGLCWPSPLKLALLPATDAAPVVALAPQLPMSMPADGPVEVAAPMPAATPIALARGQRKARKTPGANMPMAA